MPTDVRLLTVLVWTFRLDSIPSRIREYLPKASQPFGDSAGSRLASEPVRGRISAKTHEIGLSYNAAEGSLQHQSPIAGCAVAAATCVW